ncbi:type I restriction endonuclease subunit R [Pseudomonas aeruginosa]|uniref:type I restriction endonuclease subunit R n=1 Tax=Pseudomonas aeruginosa TaxID=287 RepID=UPI00093785EB|nr:type I restriction endonuclease subunit R [Pseudomonas aeruginosa]MDU0535595.1 type I restriction endonuclease subunit R [Pseudomonas aeruginosa]MEA8679781.1 type I restriction endonuclease subunit R [Pseudomonas aeruginosa]MEA8692815.1 type I restriction endonuclease subunit R [Pseudomonas aeruginosa]MEE2519102.1 type I restriction endonuclease subunit R [Pseudomonas aeruginosa]HCF3548901.1 type I restriction endonuclease subunit R [Pseudomonas aeruginosa]
MSPAAPHSHDYSEDTLVEQPAIVLFESLGWETGNLYAEWTGSSSSEGRQTQQDVVLEGRLRVALSKLNPDLPSDAINLVVEELARDRSKLLPVNANQEVYRLLKDGVPVSVTDEHGHNTLKVAKVIDWGNVEENDFFLASQFWVKGDYHTRRTDLLGFVNGIPLLFVELKATHKTLKAAYDDNLTDYRTVIPQLFTYNGALMLSNGSQTVVGSTFSPWEHLFEWKRINDEGEKGVVSLETAIRGIGEPSRLLDIVENFTVFEDVAGGVIKKIAKNHQYLGVNKAIAEVWRTKDRPKDQAGRLGVFWHTQGSGKSLSMVFFAQKILRKIPGNWTFVIVTDRNELDEQIYKTFAATGAVGEVEAHATSGAHLKQLLSEDHRYVFTLIQKFGTKKGEVYPQLSDRQDIIVITDEAHRSQYDTLAMNMRTALPNAAFLGFTGTPLMAGEEKTKEVFGDYISVYDFGQSIADGATVPLYYENRIPEMQLINDNLNEDMAALLEEAELDEEQERKVEQVFAREYHLITREDRLEAIAKDLVNHFVGRGYQGKAMLVCIDKATAVRMYNKVQDYWKTYLAELKAQLAKASKEQQEELQHKIQVMTSTDMAVVVSQGQNEVKELADKGLDIIPHRKRMNEENLGEKFKDSKDPLRLVFVCAMWITGFDVPSCSTIYLDKPMKNHTLMQTIARANRKYPGKEAGLIVDYVGVFRKLQEALAIYGGASSGEGGEGEPIKNKAELVEYLKHLLARGISFLSEHGVNAQAIKDAQGFEKVAKLDDAVEQLIGNEETKNSFMNQARIVSRVYKAILPDPDANELAPDAVLISVIAQKIKALAPPVDISEVMQQVEELLDRSIAPVPYIIKEDDDQPLHDLSQIDFEKLKEKFNQGRKRTEAEKLRALLSMKLETMLTENPTRKDFMEKFQKLIDAYNSGSLNIEVFFKELVDLTADLQVEDQRAIRENLSEEELALFDILTKPVPELAEKEKAQVKKVCKELLETLKAEKLVLDWRKKDRARSDVRRTLEIVFDRGLPESYDEGIYNEKCELAFHHIFTSYYGAGESVYSAMR